MKFQILLSTMNKDSLDFINTMRINSNAIIINQTNKFDYSSSKYKDSKIQFISMPEIGVGLSRNTALMRASAEICLFADDDVVYESGYEKKVIDAFQNNPKADMIIFNLPSKNPDRPEYLIKNNKKVRWYSSLRYGSFRIAIRLQSQREAGVYFSLLFGGGTKYSAGEDSLFVYQCIKNGLRAYACPEIIGYVTQETSTWFNGYTDKFFYDKGAFYACLSPIFGRVFATQYILRKYKSFNTNKSILALLRLVNEGAKGYERK
jgi:glycosyltransferase involved in cell wall biosynthesis